MTFNLAVGFDELTFNSQKSKKCTILGLIHKTQSKETTLCESYKIQLDSVQGVTIILRETTSNDIWRPSGSFLTEHTVFEGCFKYGFERDIILWSLKLYKDLLPKWLILYKYFCFTRRGEWKDIFLGNIIPHYIPMITYC